MGVQKGHENRLLHQIMNELNRGVQHRRRRRDSLAGMPEKNIITDLAGDVDFPRGSGDNVSGQKSLPEHTQVAGLWAVGRNWELSKLAADAIISFPVPLRIHCEFQGLQTVVLRKVGHKGAKGVRSRCRIREHLIEGRTHGTESALRNSQT
jgi:hypothetical protein